MTDNKNDIEDEISEIESDLAELRKSISQYDDARKNTQTSAHIEGLLTALKDIEKEVKNLPDIIRKVSDDNNN